MLVRAASRERELAVRSALGGSRWALVRQMLVESMAIAGLGTLLGLGLAWAGIRLLLTIGPENLPRLDHTGIDPMVLGFSVLAAFVSAIVFGVTPAVRASRVPAAEALRAGGRNAGLAGGRRLRSAVVVAEVALAFVLLVGSGLMIRSFVALTRVNPGYDAHGILTFFLPNLNRPQPMARAALVQQLSERLRALPGVTGVTAANPLPLDGGLANMRWGPEAAAADPRLFQQANLHTVLPGYFETMGTRLIEGRTFSAADNDTLLKQLVVDVNFARKAFPGQSAAGKTILARIRTNEAEPWQIIGVVEHQRHETLARDGPETVFVPDGTFFFGAASRWVVRTSGDPALLAGTVRNAVRELDPSLAITDLQPMAVFLDKARAPTRFALVLIGVFAAIAVILGAVGLFGVLATMVRQRTAEIGVRMAFGAPQASILRLVVGHGMRLSLIGVALGAAAALALTRVMQTMLVGVGATDPLTFGVMAVLFLAIGAAACALPARQAARLDPNAALREE